MELDHLAGVQSQRILPGWKAPHFQGRVLARTNQHLTGQCLLALAQDELLLPLLLGEKTWAVRIFHNRWLGPGFRPSRM